MRNCFSGCEPRHPEAHPANCNHHQLAFAFFPPDLHRRAQALGQALFETGDIRVGLTGSAGLAWFAAQPLANQGFGLTHGQAACDNVSRPSTC